MDNLINPSIEESADNSQISEKVRGQLDVIVGNVGEALDLSKKLSDLVGTVATAWADILGTNPTFEEWTSQRKYLVEHVAEAKGVEQVTVNDFMTKVVNHMKVMFYLHKPTKDTKQATLKNAKRQAEREALAEMSDSELQDGIDSNVESAKYKEAEKLQGEVKRRAKEATKDAEAEAKEWRTKITQTSIKEGLGTNVRHITGLLSYLEADNEVKDQICNLLGVAE